MKERPVLFSGAMVRALLDGSKTQTRRVVKPAPEADQVLRTVTGSSGFIYSVDDTPPVPYPAVRRIRWDCPYGQPGDRLWVRETFGYVSPDEFERPHAECNIEYRADLPLGCTDRPGSWPADECAGDPARPRWRPSIYMPRAASRILLEIVSVRVERLQGIGEADCWAEGIEAVAGALDDLAIIHLAKRMGCSFEDAAPTYAALWESINGAGSWDANPWVWVVEFKRVAAC